MRSKRLFLTACLVIALAPMAFAQLSVDEAMDRIVTRLYADMTLDQLNQLNEADVQKLITPEERQAFAENYWCFDVNVPVIVSVMRHVDQQVAPFWLEERGFEKTALQVRNEEYAYEIWQKAFPAGRVGLGINGFDKHRPHYFVSVGAQEAGAALELTNLHPANQKLTVMENGASIYHDWTELVLLDVPEELNGHVLLPTIRGRAREAHIIGAFRTTPFPATAGPDQITLTWSGDPCTSQSIQWRTDMSVARCTLRYRPDTADGEWKSVEAEGVEIDDLLLANDRRMNHYTANLEGLKPGTAYRYAITPEGGAEVEGGTFKTAPAADEPFTFVVLSDVHNQPWSGVLLKAAEERHDDLAFCAVAGDFVGTGQYRNDWDEFLAHSAPFFADRPLVPTIGNHDCIDGLGADLYCGLFALPENGPKSLDPELTYALRYGNALLLMLDATSPIEIQSGWIERQLAETDAVWKFAILHFPPYSPEEDYPDIRAAWCTLFDKYGVDFVLSGHVHELMRTYPLRGGKAVDSPAEGTVYIITIALPGKGIDLPKPEYAEVRTLPKPAVYQAFSIDGKRLVTRAYDAEGHIHDELVVEK